MEFIIIIIVFWLSTSIVLNISEENQVVIIKDKFTNRTTLIRKSIGFKMPYPLQKVVGQIKLEDKISKYIDINGNGHEFELSYKVVNPEKAYSFVNGLDDYLFEFIYNIYENNTYEEAIEVLLSKLSIVFEKNGLLLNNFNIK